MMPGTTVYSRVQVSTDGQDLEFVLQEETPSRKTRDREKCLVSSVEMIEKASGRSGQIWVGCRRYLPYGFPRPDFGGTAVWDSAAKRLLVFLSFSHGDEFSITAFRISPSDKPTTPKRSRDGDLENSKELQAVLQKHDGVYSTRFTEDPRCSVGIQLQGARLNGNEIELTAAKASIAGARTGRCAPTILGYDPQKKAWNEKQRGAKRTD